MAQYLSKLKLYFSRIKENNLLWTIHSKHSHTEGERMYLLLWHTYMCNLLLVITTTTFYTTTALRSNVTQSNAYAWYQNIFCYSLKY